MNAPAYVSRIKGGEHLAAACEAIRQQGIREAREHHMARLKLARSLHNIGMFAAFIHPAQSVGEAIDDANEFLRSYRRMTTWRRGNRYRRMIEAKECIVILRYFRRYSAVIWPRRAVEEASYESEAA